MSRIGKRPVAIPAGVKVAIDGQVVTVHGPKGALSCPIHPVITARIDDGSIVVERRTEGKLGRSLHGLTRSLIANMIQGVTMGFSKALDIQGVGYRAEVQGANLTLVLGFSHPIILQTPPGIQVDVQNQTRIVVSGIDKQLVGQVAAIIRSFKKPEPYKGKGIRYEGEQVRRKAGKTGV